MVRCGIDAIPVLFSLGFLLQKGFILLCSHLSHRQILLPAQLRSRDWPKGLVRPAEILRNGCSAQQILRDQLEPALCQMGFELM
jgi:hypothetical protein